MSSPRTSLLLSAFLVIAAVGVAGAQRPSPFTVAQIKSYPFPNELTVSATGARLAWALNERGLRNIYVAEAPDFVARKLTSYDKDDGQELTSVAITSDGRNVLYVRGGDHGSNWNGPSPNPISSPIPPKIQLWTIPFAGGTPKLIAEGDDPELSPKSDQVAFVKDRAIWVAATDGSGAARKLFSANGDASEPQWSPDGSRLAFVSNRGDHSFIGIYSGDSTPIRWLAPTTSRDFNPRWSPDGSRIAFVRVAGSGGAPDSVLANRPMMWSIWTADASTGDGRQLWASPTNTRSFPSTHGGTNLHWGAGDRLVFLTYADAWPHLYSVPASGGLPLLLTPGNFMAEYITMSNDGRWLFFAGNTGADADDMDRRHVVRVPIDRAEPKVITPGTGLEWTPMITGDGKWIAYIGATAQRPPLPAVMPVAGGATKWIGADRIPADFPTSQLVTPKKVVFRSPDGVEVHAQLFEAPGIAGRKPAIIYVHGGPPRQMLLGWHYSDYYSNSYAMNQILASKGYVVLSVNYRLGIGYGREFQHPANAGTQGASEYIDVKAGADWLAQQPNVDPSRIGIYGGSYGGFLTAMALARNSDRFAAGVDIHGVHDWTAERVRPLLQSDRYERIPDADSAVAIAWRSSPVSSVAGWRSPVLLIHGDDDRNVRFNQTVDLARRLAARGVPYEELIVPDDTHHWMRWANAVKVDAATADFFDRKFGGQRAATR